MLAGCDSTYVIELNGGKQKTYNKIPLQCVSKQVAQKINVEALIETGISALKKFMLTKDQKKNAKSGFKQHLEDITNQIDDDHILVRVEKCGAKKTNFSLEKWHRSSVGLRIAKLKDTVSVHEVVSG